METRDQWYKPNLLYNIHYRPPKKPEPPKMIVETVQFNPSVCTCGEHGYQPQYRMERRVLWTNKEVINTQQQTKINDRENKNEYKESKFEQRITKQNGEIGKVIESKQMELKEENDQELRFMIEGDGNKCGSAESFKERMFSDAEVRSGYNAFCGVKEKENVEIDGDDDNDDEKEEKKDECIYKNEIAYSNSNDDICIDEAASNTNNSKENNSNGKSERDNYEDRNSEGVYGEKNTGKDSESDFIDECKLCGNRFKEDKIDQDQMTGEGHGAVDRDYVDDDKEYCSEKRIHINNSDETDESCSFENEDEGLWGIEIASAFGIMSIYCKSELHSWMSFKGEDTSKKIH